MGYEMPGERGQPIWQQEPFEVIGYEAVIGGRKFSTQASDLVCGPESFEADPKAFGREDPWSAPMLWRTKASKTFFYLFRGKFQVLGEAAARDKYQDLKYAAMMTEAEAFGTDTVLA